MLSLFDLAALLLTASASFSWLNRRFLRLPHAIGLLTMGLAASLLLVLVDLVAPGRHLYDALTGTLRQIDFADVLMNGMLAFLIFAGALNVDLAALRRRAVPVALLALLGTLISTVLVGLAAWLVSGWLADLGIGPRLPLAWALVLGALISPTDPVAVLSTLRDVAVPASLEAEMKGEALFNDGVGIVLFTLLLRFATGRAGGDDALPQALRLLTQEAGGGLLLGVLAGMLAYRMMRAIDDFPAETLITLALVTGSYALAQRLHVSGPLAMVAAGLIIGDRGPRYAFSARTNTYVCALWTLIDEILNAVLFLLIGLEVLVLGFDAALLPFALALIPIVLGARLIAITPPLLLIRWVEALTPRNLPFLTWAGIRGGISVALALSVPEGPQKPALLAATYAVVLFSILVQGGTLQAVARRTLRTEP